MMNCEHRPKTGKDGVFQTAFALSLVNLYYQAFLFLHATIGFHSLNVLYYLARIASYRDLHVRDIP
jgi:hypothetical protein